MPILKISGIAMLLSACLLTATIVRADERTNPFVKPPSDAELKALQDERMKNIVWELQPELKSMIMQEVRADQNSLEAKMQRKIDDAVKNIPVASAVIAPTAGPGGTTTTGTGEAPEESKFISCVNGKALYRDKDNTLFQVAGNGIPGSDRCAR